MRKAQLTVYIIFGIVILTALSSAIYLSGKFGLKQEQFVPKEVTIKNYIENCLQQTSKEAIKKLGEHGGYIDPTDVSLNKKTFNFETNPTESDALYLSPPDKTQVIYWWQLKSRNDCKECNLTTENKPTLTDELIQVEEYVTREIPKCLNNFEPFVKQAQHVSAGNRTTKAILTENDVKIILTMPTTISKAGTYNNEQTFETTINVPLKKIYLLAEKITNDEIEKQRLEQLFLHQIATYSEVNPTKLPPLTKVTHTPETITWTKQAVEENVKQALALMTALIRLNNTKDAKEVKAKNEIEQGAYNALFYSIENTSNQELSVNYNYLGQKIYFNIGPTTQNKLLPDTDRTSFPLNLVAPFKTNYYEFFYDVSAPILVQIKSQSALKGEGYTFNIGLEINIRKNKNFIEYHFGEGTIVPWDSTILQPNATLNSYDFTPCQKITDNKFTCTLDNKEYNETRFCAQNCKTNKTQTITPKINKTLFCEPDQRLSGTIKINAIDAETNTPIEDAELVYICGKQIACQIGTTNQRGTLKQKLPICYNGLLKVSADNRQTKTELLTTEQDKREEITTKLEQIRTINLTIKKQKIKFSNDGQKDCCDLDTINPFEKALITLEKVKENPWDTQFTSIVNYETTQQKHTIEITPGKYKINAVLFDSLGFAIPKACKSVCVSRNDDRDCTGWKFYPEENQIFKPAMLGGVNIDNETGYFEISTEMLAKTKTLEINVLKLLTPTCTDTIDCTTTNCIGLEELGNVQQYSKQFKQQIWPKIHTVNS